MSDNCLFCKIAKHEIPTKIRFENEEFIAFDDMEPKAKVHILIIPKKHLNSVADLMDSDTAMMGRLIMSAKAIAGEMGLISYRLVANSGKDAGQAVDHLHFHILGGNQLGDIA